MFEGIYFEFPKVASLLFIFLACEALCRMRQRAIYFPSLSIFAAVSLKPSYWLWVLKWISISLLLTALMSPVRDEAYQPESAPGYAMTLVVDASASMRNGDFDLADRTRSRFEAVQEILRDFVAHRRSNTIGMVVFGTHAFVASPPTSDLQTLSTIIDRLYVGIAGKYTALYEAIAKGIFLLQRSESAEKVVIVLTDGRNTPGAPVSAEVAESLAEKEGVRIYAVLIGEAPAAQETALSTLAEQSGGAFFTATDAKALESVYAKINRLEKSPQRAPAITVKAYYYIYPLFAGFLTLLLYVYWRNRRAV